ncbi:MAG: cation-efflux pump [Gemmatimonadota bacterium]|jgi:cation diffusion facilitator family transporter|nr:cation-efflux pump [Gemmatimonadota bacterium]
MTMPPDHQPLHNAQTSDQARKEHAALFSILASAGITLGKLIAGLLSGSLALLSEAAHALVDTGATIVTYFAVRTAHKPADAEHQYGHGKFESLAALAEMVVLFILATLVLVGASRRIAQGGGHVEPTPLVFGVLIISILVDINRVHSLRKIAMETGSQALAADAIHFASDLAGSVLVLLGLVAALFGFKYGDAIAAIGIALFIAIAGWRLGRRTIDTLLDTAPKGIRERISTLVAAIPGIVRIDQLRLRSDGAEIFGEIDVSVSRTLPLERVMAIREQIQTVARQVDANTHLTVTVIPRALDNETVLERVMLTAVKRRLPVHHVTVQNLGERLAIGLDIEVNGSMSLRTAHGLASKFEAAIRDELGATVEVDTHIEPLEVVHLAGENAPAAVAAPIAETIASLAAHIGTIRDMHDIRVRQTPTGLVVTYHCHADPSLDIQSVHDANDFLERRIRGNYPDIIRVIGHAEPGEEAILSN